MRAGRWVEISEEQGPHAAVEQRTRLFATATNSSVARPCKLNYTVAYSRLKGPCECEADPC
jgi:hypothetical protein